MNELQKKEYEILIEFDKICKKNNLTYFLAYGTAIGAVRHGGFIPWDDDIDVFMLRGDYEKLCKLPQTEFGESLLLQNVYSEIQCPVPFSKLRNVNSTFQEALFQDLDICQGIWMDIFPLDFIPNNRFRRMKQMIEAEILWDIMGKYRTKSFGGKLISNFLTLGCGAEGYRKKIRKYEGKISKYQNKSDKLALLVYGGRAIYARQYFDVKDFEKVNIQFEDKEFCIMKGYDSVLTIGYGDYMKIPPKEERQTHEAVVVDCNAAQEK